MSRRNFTPYIKKGAILIVTAILVLIIKSLISSISETLDRTKMLSYLEEELSQKKQESAYLKERLIIAKTEKFVEEEARIKLGMVREGEKIVGDRKIEAKKLKIERPELPNWKKWQNLFF
jgi:cell division protein FtsB